MPASEMAVLMTSVSVSSLSVGSTWGLTESANTGSSQSVTQLQP